ncbi:GATA-type sexual development transcription factor NsdD [Purpureocillium lavendulum]|uniref:GATA-type sexual development transcription factor NsdD n=1 Tax=Purpureocillium lavendulum TaxID=1247861 RepID=A0AB34FQQ7_9HYPO|nr:GATA-type sexual development transcription factor NsdD [Purpureocillium lavendulum]
MATATVLAPSAHYPTQTSYTSGYPQHPPPATAAPSNMMATEPRRSSDDNESSGRQSLPSISEVISGARPGQYPPAHVQSGPGLPSPFTQPSHQYPESDKRSSPQPVHPATGFPQRPETLPALTDSPRPPFTGRHSLPPVSDRRPTPPAKPESAHQHAAKPSDSMTQNGAYAHPPPPPPPTSHPTSHPYQPGQLPPGQVPLPNYPISPRHGVPIAPGHYDPRGPPVHPDDADYANRARYDPSLNRHFETWSYQDSLSRIGSSSRTIFNFAEAYTRIAREQHGSQPIPQRLPTDREVSEMLANVDLIKRSLEQVKDAVQASIQSERAREGTKVKGTYEEDHDVAICNRIDTPEWRRGPDGARTLCNACGLHYAKLERKRQLEARSIRPKPEDRS